MAPGDHRGTEREATRPAEASTGASTGASHWVRWHAAYEDPSSNLSLRLRTVQAMVREVLDDHARAAGASEARTFRVVSLCAGQGRDVIDVVATHPQRAGVCALLVELDPELAAFARARAAAAGVEAQVRVEQGDAARSLRYAGYVPADLVLVCGVFGNISPSDIARTIRALSGWCTPGGHVIWTRHRRPPDATPGIRADFAAAGFTELAFVAPPQTVMTVGHHRFDGDPSAAPPFDPDETLFDFIGDGFAPA
jgi:Methyltransferase domain